MGEPSENVGSAGLRDYLAAERTLLAWVRTGLALMVFGFVVARFGLFLQQLQVAQHAPRYGLTGSLCGLELRSFQPGSSSIWFQDGTHARLVDRRIAARGYTHTRPRWRSPHPSS